MNFVLNMCTLKVKKAESCFLSLFFLVDLSWSEGIRIETGLIFLPQMYVLIWLFNNFLFNFSFGIQRKKSKTQWFPYVTIQTICQWIVDFEVIISTNSFEQVVQFFMFKRWDLKVISV